MQLGETPGFCRKSGEANPDCAACQLKDADDILDNLKKELPEMDIEYSYGVSMLFHPDAGIRAAWRSRFCPYFAVSPQ